MRYCRHCNGKWALISKCCRTPKLFIIENRDDTGLDEREEYSGFYALNWLIPLLQKCQILLCLIAVLWKYQVFWKIQSPVTTDEMIGVHEYFKFIRGGTGTRRLGLPASGQFALPGITRTRPGITLKYGRIRILGVCVNFCDSRLGLYLTQ